jgi:hypothetical protein
MLYNKNPDLLRLRDQSGPRGVPFVVRIGAERGARKERPGDFCQHFYRKTQNQIQTVALQAFMSNVFLESEECNLHLSVKKKH